jgi:hypothetical protein
MNLFYYVFWGLSARGVQKNHKNIFAKSPGRKLFQKKSTKISMSDFLRLFLFYRVFGCFSAMGVQKHCKKRFTKQILSKSFYKKFDQKSKTDFFRYSLYHVFGRFSVRGVQKCDKNKKISKNKSDPSPFLYPYPPTHHVAHHGGHRFLLVAGQSLPAPCPFFKTSCPLPLPHQPPASSFALCSLLLPPLARRSYVCAPPLSAPAATTCRYPACHLGFGT